MTGYKRALVDVDLGANPLVPWRVDSQALHDHFTRLRITDGLIQPRSSLDRFQ